MLTIACLSQKGGVGKSTLARLIARTYAKAEWRVKIADFNTKQKTSVDWCAMRMDQGVKPEIAAEAFTSIKSAIRQEDQFDLMVFDGRPDSDVSSLEIAREANLILVPCSTSFDDLSPQVKFAHELLSKGIPRSRILFVINRAAESQVAVDEAKSFVTSAGYAVAKTDIPARTGYEMAQNSGRALTETSFVSLNIRADELAQEVVEILTKATDAAA